MWWKIADMEDGLLYKQAVIDTENGELSSIILDYIDLVV